MTHSTDTAELDLEADHQALIDIFRSAELAASICRHVAPCDQETCSQSGECARRTREHFHRVLFGSMGRFSREERVLKKALSAASFQQHAESHADIMTRLHAAIAAFTKNRNIPAAFDMIESIARTYEVHHQIFDSRCVTPPPSPLPGRPASGNRHIRLPDLRMTGDARTDSKHVLLHSILQQALTLCDNQRDDCSGCHAHAQHRCMSEVTVLIGDTLKHMVDTFRHEDAIIRQMPSCAERDDHLRAHGDIARRIGQLIDDFEDQNTARGLYRLINILHEWLDHHVADYDLALFSPRSATAAASSTTAACSSG